MALAEYLHMYRSVIFIGKICSVGFRNNVYVKATNQRNETLNYCTLISVTCIYSTD